MCLLRPAPGYKTAVRRADEPVLQGNILLGADGNLKLADLGCAQTNIIVGRRASAQAPRAVTPCMCPPEYFQGERAFANAFLSSFRVMWSLQDPAEHPGMLEGIVSTILNCIALANLI